MLHIGSIFFPLKVAPMRIDNKFIKDIKLGNGYNKTKPICESFKVSKFDAVNIKWFAVVW